MDGRWWLEPPPITVIHPPIPRLLDFAQLKYEHEYDSDAPRPDPISAPGSSAFPTQPGIYIMKNAADDVLYVGKAQSLRNRVRSYFQSQIRHDPKRARWSARSPISR